MGWMIHQRRIFSIGFTLIHNHFLYQGSISMAFGKLENIGLLFGNTTSITAYTLDGPKRLDLVHHLHTFLAPKVSRGFWEERHHSGQQKGRS
jgi:hypothetical protein